MLAVVMIMAAVKVKAFRVMVVVTVEVMGRVRARS